jgi:hypothetical protein
VATRRGRRLRDPASRDSAERPTWQRVLRRPALWAGGVATAVVISVLTGLAQEGISALTKKSPSVTGPSIKVAALQLEADESSTYVFPEKLDLTAADLRVINNPEQYDRWAWEHGGVDDQQVNIKLVLEGNRQQPVRILAMRPLKLCRQPLTGTLLFSPSAGADPSIRVGIDLDEPRPVARKLEDGQLTGDYFADTTVSLKQGEQQTFQITARTLRQYCEFTLELRILDNGKTITQEIANGSEPFRVSAVKATGEYGQPGRYRSYQAVYVGGVASPRNGEFVKVDPLTYSGE